MGDQSTSNCRQSNDTRDIVAAMAVITNAVNDGSLTAEEADHLMHVLDGYAKALKDHDLSARLEALEIADEKRNPMTRDLRKEDLKSSSPRCRLNQLSKIRLSNFASAY